MLKTCPKCGNGSASVYYRYKPSRLFGLFPEHLKFLCGECRYTWKELPLDKQKEAARHAQST